MSSKYKTHAIATEKTFIMVKPDGVMRGLVGEVIKRIEQRGLKVIAMKMVCASREKVDSFYPTKDEWVERLGNKALGTFAEHGIDPVAEIGTDDPKQIGLSVRDSLLEYMQMGPVIPMVVEGVHAISVIRKIVGSTLPISADLGTIRGDYSHDASTSANMENRSIFNIVHASENKEEAVHEIKHWFDESEICEYDRSDHVVMFGDKRHL